MKKTCVRELEKQEKLPVLENFFKKYMVENH
jgi:hypothetical protein